MADFIFIPKNISQKMELGKFLQTDMSEKRRIRIEILKKEIDIKILGDVVLNDIIALQIFGINYCHGNFDLHFSSEGTDKGVRLITLHSNLDSEKIDLSLDFSKDVTACNDYTQELLDRVHISYHVLKNKSLFKSIFNIMCFDMKVTNKTTDNSSPQILTFLEEPITSIIQRAPDLSLINNV